MNKIRYISWAILIFILNSFIFGKGGTKIPDLEIKMLDGRRTSIYKLLKKGPLLIDFWATWCTPCKKLMVHLDDYHQKYEDEGFQVLMINQDTPRSLGKVKSYINSKKHKFLVAVDPNQQLAKKLNGQIMPSLILVNSDASIVWRHQGFMPGEEKEIQKKIEHILNENPKVEK
tara:strand:- start:624 stop:1142 length:519 start_codon:yes stop_codon:yes gene_type:complete